MDIRFDNQVVLVTGASTGIGAAIARAYGEAGACVVVHYNQSAEAARGVAAAVVSGGGRALLVQADVADRSQPRRVVERTLEEFGRIDILINNAGGLLGRHLLVDMPDELYDEVIALNLTSVYQFCKHVIPVMQRQGKGNIVNVTSIAARMGGAGGSSVYASAKGAVSSFTRSLARELAADNIRVNALSPGVILTPFHERYTTPEKMAQMVATIPMGRAGTAEECVGAVFFLTSDVMSSYVTGQIIEVNGGQVMP